MKIQNLKIIRSIISIVIVITMTIANMAFILPTITYAANTSEKKVSNTSSNNQNNRDINSLKKSPDVTLSPDGKQVVAAVQGKNGGFTEQEIKTMFGGSAKPNLNATNKGKIDYAQFEAKYKFSKDDINRAQKLHGSIESLSYELTCFDNSESFTKLSDDNKNGILTLIKNGYTNSQAFAAYIASGILGLSIDELAKMKADEISSKQQNVDALYMTINDSTDLNSMKEQNPDYLNLSTKMGVPYSIVEKYMSNNSTSCTDISSKFDKALKDAYKPANVKTEKSALYSSNDNKSVVVNSSESSRSFVNEPMLTGTDFSQYAPEQILEKPYSYASNGDLQVDVNNGKFSYTETDLHIPGVNGLDLNITRQFNSQHSQSADPLSWLDPNYKYSPALKAGYIA
jgi:hypothetical protein